MLAPVSPTKYGYDVKSDPVALTNSILQNYKSYVFCSRPTMFLGVTPSFYSTHYVQCHKIDIFWIDRVPVVVTLEDWRSSSLCHSLSVRDDVHQ